MQIKYEIYISTLLVFLLSTLQRKTRLLINGILLSEEDEVAHQWDSPIHLSIYYLEVYRRFDIYSVLSSDC